VETRGGVQPTKISTIQNINHIGHLKQSRSKSAAFVNGDPKWKRFEGEHPSKRWSQLETRVPDYAPLENQITIWTKESLIEAWFPRFSGGGHKLFIDNTLGSICSYALLIDTQANCWPDNTDARYQSVASRRSFVLTLSFIEAAQN
jgi:hypothetical protein